MTLELPFLCWLRTTRSLLQPGVEKETNESACVSNAVLFYLSVNDKLQSTTKFREPY